MTVGIILAAGQGTRNFPYVEARNKCALPVVNKPAVRYTAEALLEAGCQGLIVVTGHLASSVRAAVADLSNTEFVVQKSLDGTANAALEALSCVGDDDDVVIAYGDIVTEPGNIKSLIEKFQKEKPQAAVLLDRLTHENGGEWICGGLAGDKLSGIEGHPRGGGHRIGGVFAFSPEGREFIRATPPGMRVPVGGMPSPETDLAQTLQEMINSGVEVLATETDGYHIDIDKPWHILEANEDVATHMSANLEASVIPVSATVSEAAEIHGKIVLGENAVIGPRAVIKGDVWLGDRSQINNGPMVGGPTIIGADTRVSDYCQLSGVVGPRCVVGHGAEMSGLMMEKTYLYHYCEMYGIFGTACDIGAATVCGTLRFDDGPTTHRIKGRKETPPKHSNASYLGEYTRTGVNAILMPGVKVGPWSVVGAGVVLNEDVPARKMILVEQETVSIDWGPDRYGW